MQGLQDLQGLRYRNKGNFFSFLRGVASAFDISGSLRLPDIYNGAERDRQAIAGDWVNTGNDINRSMNRFSYGK